MKKYLRSCQSEFWQDVFKRETEYLVRALKGYKDILSVGCGPAIVERGLQENGFNVIGLDVSEDALEEASDSIRTVVGSAEKMEFNDATFDAAIYVVSLQFIDDYKKAIQETARVLKPNGKLVVMLLNPLSEFFEVKGKQTGSYVSQIKHPYLAPIEKIIRGHFAVDKAEYRLGIRNKRIFDSQNPSLAALYIIQGTKS